MSKLSVTSAITKALETPKGHGVVSKAEAKTITQAALTEAHGAPKVSAAEAGVMDKLLQGDSFDGGKTHAQLSAPARQVLENFAVTQHLPMGADTAALKGQVETVLAHVDTGAPLTQTPSLSNLHKLVLSDQRPVDGALREALINPADASFYLRTTGQSRGQGKLVSYFGPFPLAGVTPPEGKLSAADLGVKVNQAANGYLFPSETDVPLHFLVGAPTSAVTADIVAATFTPQHDAAADGMFGITGAPRLADKFVQEVPADEFFTRYANAYDPNDQVMVDNAQKFAAVADLLKANLTDLHVYRFTEHDPADRFRSAGEVSIFMAGRSATGELVGVMTGAVET